jgi:hypothetical protein
MPRFPTLTRDQACHAALYEDNADALFDDAERGSETDDPRDLRLSDADWREHVARVLLAELVGK